MITKMKDGRRAHLAVTLFIVAAGTLGVWVEGWAQPAPPREVTVRCLTLNVHGGIDASVQAVALFVKKQTVDLVSLQEVPSRAYGQTVASTARMHMSVLDHGKTILSRTPILTEQVLPLTSSRSLVHVTTEITGIPVSVYGVHIHWDSQGDAQARQMAEQILPEDPNPRKIVFGDFNDEHYSTQITTLETVLADAWSDLQARPGEHTTWPAIGWDVEFGTQMIDLLLYDPAGGLRPLEAKVFDDLRPVLSDHRPAVYTLALADPIVVSPPNVLGVDAVFGARTIEAYFDREVDTDSGGVSSNYRITRADGKSGPEVLGAAVGPYRRRVRLTTGPHAASERYTLWVDGVAARAGTVGTREAMTDYRYLENLLTNPGAENGIDGWDVSGHLSEYTELEQLRPYTGARFFGGGADDVQSWAAQRIDLSPWREAIDAQRATLEVSAFLATGYRSFANGASRSEGYDDVEVRIDVENAAGALLLQRSSGKFDTLNWHPFRAAIPLPPGSAAFRVVLATDRKLLRRGRQNHGGFDDVYAAVRTDAEHGQRTGNLLANADAESPNLSPWTVRGGLRHLENYTVLGRNRFVAHSRDGLLFSPSAATMEQIVELPEYSPLDYLRWGGAVRTFESRMEAVLRLEFLGPEGELLRVRESDAARAASWRILEHWTPIPLGATRVRMTVNASRAGSGVCFDDFFVEVQGGVGGNGWFSRGDLDRDERRTVSDAILVLFRLFGTQGAPTPCGDAADVDDDGELRLADALYLLRYLFSDGSAPPAPGLADPGADPTADDLECR